MLDVFLTFLMTCALCATALMLWFDSTFPVHLPRLVRWHMVQMKRTTYDDPIWTRNNMLPGEAMALWTRANFDDWIRDRLYSRRPALSHLMQCSRCLGQRISIATGVAVSLIMLARISLIDCFLVLIFCFGTNVVAHILWQAARREK